MGREGRAEKEEKNVRAKWNGRKKSFLPTRRKGNLFCRPSKKSTQVGQGYYSSLLLPRSTCADDTEQLHQRLHNFTSFIDSNTIQISKPHNDLRRFRWSRAHCHFRILESADFPYSADCNISPKGPTEHQLKHFVHGSHNAANIARVNVSATVPRYPCPSTICLRRPAFTMRDSSKTSIRALDSVVIFLADSRNALIGFP